jgi:hypothetical protein
MFRSIEADATSNVDTCVDERVVVRACGNHRRQDFLSMEMEHGVEKVFCYRAVIDGEFLHLIHIS